MYNETRPNLEVMGPTESEILMSETLANTERNRISNYHPKMDTTMVSSLDRTNHEVYNLMKHGKKQRLQVNSDRGHSIITVPAPLKGAPYIQKLFFFALKLSNKKHIKIG